MSYIDRCFRIVSSVVFISVAIFACSRSQEALAGIAILDSPVGLAATEKEIPLPPTSTATADTSEQCVGGKDRLLNMAKEIEESDLMRCIRYGFTPEALANIDAGVDLEAENRIGQTALTYAVLTDNIEVFEALMNDGASIEISYRYPLIVSAVHNGNLRMVQTLLDRGVNPNSTDPEGSSVLWIAAYAGDMAMARLLLASGTDVRFDTRGEFSGGPPLIGAVYGRHRDMMLLLLDEGADVNQPEWYHNRTALWMTVCRFLDKDPDIELARFLVEHGADVETRDAGGFSGNINDGRTPLKCAVDRGDVEMVKLLISAKANVNAKGYYNGVLKTVLEMAEEKGNSEILKLLRQKSGDQ